MMSFLKSFLGNEKTAEERALMSALGIDAKRDVLVVGGEPAPEEPPAGCGTQKSGCGGCGCG